LLPISDCQQQPPVSPPSASTRLPSPRQQRPRAGRKRQRLRKAAARPSRRPRWLLLIQGSRPPLKLRYIPPLSLEVCSNSSSTSTSGYCPAVSPDHQKITVDRYARLLDLTNVYVMSVLQGYSPRSYAAHVDCYGELLTPGQWVGVGSVCKRNGNPDQIEDILLTIKTQRL
jgi:hypothetical protein